MPFTSQTSIDILAGLDQVWDAITKPEIVKQYFFNTNLITDWIVGHPIFFRGEWQGRRYQDKGDVLSFEPKVSLSYSYWSEFGGLLDDPSMYQVITIVLEPMAETVRLTLTQSNVQTQPSADHAAENWKMVFGGLKQLLETGKVGV